MYKVKDVYINFTKSIHISLNMIKTYILDYISICVKNVYVNRYLIVYIFVWYRNVYTNSYIHFLPLIICCYKSGHFTRNVCSLSGIHFCSYSYFSSLHEINSKPQIYGPKLLFIAHVCANVFIIHIVS